MPAVSPESESRARMKRFCLAESTMIRSNFLAAIHINFSSRSIRSMLGRFASKLFGSDSRNLYWTLSICLASSPKEDFADCASAAYASVQQPVGKSGSTFQKCE